MRSYLIMLLLAIVFTHATAAANGSMRLQKRVAKVMQTATLWAGIPLLCSGIGCSLAVHEPDVAPAVAVQPDVAEQAGDASVYQSKVVHYMADGESFFGVTRPFHGLEPTKIIVDHGSLRIVLFRISNGDRYKDALYFYDKLLDSMTFVGDRVIDTSQVGEIIVSQEARRLNEEVAFPAAAAQMINVNPLMPRASEIKRFRRAEVLYGKTVAAFSDGYRFVEVIGARYKDGSFLLASGILMVAVHTDDLRYGGTAEQQPAASVDLGAGKEQQSAVSFDPDAFEAQLKESLAERRAAFFERYAHD